MFVLIAKCKNSIQSGPANIVRGLLDHFPETNNEMIPLLLTEQTGKISFIKQTVDTILHTEKSVINVHTDGFLIPFLVYCCSLLNKRNSYYLTVHGIYDYDSSASGRRKWYYVWLERFLYRNFQNLICVSEMLKKDIEDHFGRSKKIYVIPNATDAASNVEWDADRVSIELISLGGLRKCKGIEEQLELFEYLKANGIPFHASIYGGDYGNCVWYEQEISKRDLVHQVDYCGLMRNKQDVYDTIRRADFQLCLSRYDTFNVAIAESLVLGCPCIATNRCGAAYLIEDGENGLIIDAGDTGKYEKIAAYIQSMSPKKRESIIDKRSVYADKLSWKSVCQKYADLE